MIGGAVLFGGLIAAFAVTSQYLGWFPLALAILFLAGFANSLYMVNVQGLLHSLVPDRMRGRVMGFFGMTWSVMPLGGLQSGAIASVLGAPVAVAIGGLAVAAFAVGPGPPESPSPQGRPSPRPAGRGPGRVRRRQQ